jgi:hypothetical protein
MPLRRRLLRVGGRAAVAAACALVGAVVAGAAVPRQAESVQASLSSSPSPETDRLLHPRLRIRRNGRTMYDAPVPGCAQQCRIDVARDLKILDLDGDGRLEVILRVSTLGDACCTIVDVFHRSGTSIAVISRNLYSCGAALRDLDGNGRAEIATCDPRFAGRFAAQEDSRAPLRVLALRAGQLAVVTRAYPAATRTDAAAAWRAYRARRANGEDVRGVLAARVADECLLGNGRPALSFLRSLPAAELGGGDGAQGAGYVAALRRTLRAFGYLP